MSWPRLGKWAWASILASGLAALINPGFEKDKPLPKAVKSAKANPVAVKAAEENMELDFPARRKSEAANAFNPTTWVAPPPPPPPAPPPPKPEAPPMPFSFLGHYQDKDPGIVILAKGDRVYTVTSGEVIEGTYQVGEITEKNIELTYLPLNIKQMLNIPGGS